MESFFEARGLDYGYPGCQPCVSEVGFALGKGESLALIGANGAGKSTLLQLLAGALTPCGGGLLLYDKRVEKRELPLLREKAGLVFQNAEHQLFCNTVLEDVMFGPLNLGLSPGEAQIRACAALDELGITHLKQRAPYRLSAGEKRLAAIASVLSMRPELLLLDEPSAELDPRARRELISLLNRFPQAKIIATHDLDLAVKTCSRTLLLYNGKVAADATTAQILSDDELLQSCGL